MAINNAGLVETLDTKDVGDETLRNFRYQFGYGVILLIAGATRRLPYQSIWCEHHDDFLAERNDGKFDVYQIKTGTPENGYWTWRINDGAMTKTLKKFVALHEKFAKYLGCFYIVSNVKQLETKAEKKIADSVVALRDAALTVSTQTALSAKMLKVFDAFVETFQCRPESLLHVLKNLKIINGPSRESFDLELSHEHITTLDGFKNAEPHILNSLWDEFIQRVFYASSLRVDDPSKRYCCLGNNDEENPTLKAKRITCIEILDDAKLGSPVPFRLVTDESINLSGSEENMSVLEKKLVKAGLSYQYRSMRRRALSTESKLLEIGAVNPEVIEVMSDQLTGVVEGICADGLSQALLKSINIGTCMLSFVNDKLESIARERPEMVHRQQYECLAGIMGLLAGECRVWFCEPFDLEMPL